MIIENETNPDFPPVDRGWNGLKESMMPILKAASDICEVPAALVYLHEDSDIRIFASYGVCDEPVVSAVKKITDMFDPGNGLSIIRNVREHQKTASCLSDLEMDKMQFYAGAALSSETGNKIGFFCICDSSPASSPRIRNSNFG